MYKLEVKKHEHKNSENFVPNTAKRHTHGG